MYDGFWNRSSHPFVSKSRGEEYNIHPPSTVKIEVLDPSLQVGEGFLPRCGWISGVVAAVLLWD